MPCDPENYQHVIANIIPGSGALTFDMRPIGEKIRDWNPASIAITCQCGAVTLAHYMYWKDKQAIEDARATRSAHRRITL